MRRIAGRRQARRAGKAPRSSAAVVASALLLLLAATLPAQAQGSAAPMDVVRLAGPSRTSTAAAVSARAFPDGTSTVVLARSDAYADALAGAPLAAALGAPVLLTGTTSLDPAAAEEIRRLGATEAVLLGELSPTVAGEALEVGITTVSRIRGADTWATAAEIARAVVAETGATSALLVEGANDDPARGWPDALAASAWAAAEGMPIILTTATGLPPATAEALATLGVAALSVVGGTAAVAEDVAAEAAALVGGPVERVAGATRYDTAAAVARRTVGADGYAASVWVASGTSWPDALVAGPAIARLGGSLVLSDPTTMRRSPQAADFIDAQRGHTSTAHLVGGTAVLSDAVARTVQTGERDPAPSATPPTGSTNPTPGPSGSDDHGMPALPPPVPARNSAPPIAAARPWSDPATWGGRLPQAGEVVTIPEGQAVLLDVQPPALRGIDVQGTLAVADVDMRIAVDWVLVTGHLAIGTPDAPLTADVEVVIHPRDGDDIATAGTGPITVQGGTLDIHGTAPDVPWTRLAATAVAGSTTISLQQAPDWAAGDQLVLASTSLDPDEAEERTVVAVDGTSVTLDQPLASTHWGQADVLGGVAVPQHAEVGNLTRNVVIRSSDEAQASGRGGHIQAFRGSVLRIGGAELIGLGQSGTLARYPVHFHMMGSASGSWVRGTSIHHSANRCLTIHGTDHVEVTDTIGYETFGHCYFFEDGAESGNQLRCNLGLSTRRPAEGRAILDSDHTPATFWVTNPTNHLVDNAAAGSFGHGFWYDLPEAPTGLSHTVELDLRHLPFGTFRDNVAHTSTSQGWKEGIGLFVEDYEPPAPAVFEGLVAYKNGSFGVWAEGVEVEGAVLAENNIGFLGLDSVLRRSTVVGATSNAGDRTWRVSGVGFYHRPSAITDVTFVNFAAREHDWQHPRTALEFISHHNNDVSAVSGAVFVNANRLAITDPPEEDGTVDDRTAAILDVDGSVSGAPALLTSDHPLTTDPACAWRADLLANACPATIPVTWVQVRDVGDGDLGGAWLSMAGGAEGAMHIREEEPDRANADVLADRGYRLRTDRPLSGHLEVIQKGSTASFVDLEIPWPHPTAFVYDGWGRWHEVAAVASLDDAPDVGFALDGPAGVLRVRQTLDDVEEKGRWQRLEICALPFCGAAGPG